MIICSLVLCYSALYGQIRKGFNLSNATIPIDFIRDGGPPRDGIPSIDNPKFLPVKEAGFIEPTDRVLGINFNGVQKAYPVKILNFHEIVNDYCDDQTVVITFCPLCGSGVSFNAMIEDKPRTFGVSGLLYNSDVLLYDRESETLWSQIKGEAVAGPLVGKPLEIIPTYVTSWKAWRDLFSKNLF